MENLIKKYEMDMSREEKREKKKQQMEAQGIQFNPDEVVVSEDESQEDPFKFRDKVQEYDDEPYKFENAQEHLILALLLIIFSSLRIDFYFPYNEEYKKIQDQIAKLKGLGVDNEDVKPGNEHLDQYTQVLNRIEQLQEYAAGQENEKIENDLWREEYDEIKKSYRTERESRDAHFDKRVEKEKLKRSRGVKQESPVWNESDDDK